jgi:Ca2+-binding EF-hand superfamily protein
MAIAQQSLQAALRGGANGHYADFWYDDSEDSLLEVKHTTYALEAFIWKDADAKSTDGLLTRKEAEETDLTFVDRNDDAYMSPSEIDFFGEADKVGRIQKSRVLDELLCDEEARAQGIAFFDDNGDGLMSREEYADVQSGKADVFGAADRAHEKDGAVVDGLINRKEAGNQGLMFFDGNGDGLMSRDEFANLQSDSPDVFEEADRAHEKDGAVVDGLINLEESEDQGLIFFDDNGDGLMSVEEFSLVANHQVGGLPSDRCYQVCA